MNEKITKDLAVKISDDEKKALMTSEASLDVISYFSTGLKFEKLNKINEAKKIYEKILEKDADFEPAKKRLRELSDQK